MSARISDLRALHPAMRFQAECLIEAVARAGLNMRVHETLRGPERQAAGLQRGVSKARPWTSRHNYGIAIDLVFAGPLPWGPRHPWARYGEVVRAQGLTWGGDFVGFFDGPHAQLQVKSNVMALHPWRLSCDDLHWARWARQWLLPIIDAEPAGRRVLTRVAQACCELLGHPLAHDGDWGPATERAVRKWAGDLPRPEAVAALLRAVEDKAP